MTIFRSTKFYLSIYIVLACTDILAVALDLSVVELIAKPLLMLSLLGLYMVSVARISYWYVGALIFSWLGDVFLLNKGGMFLWGIGAFLIAQILYIKIIYKQLLVSRLKHKLVASSPFLIFYIILISLLKNNLNELLIPVLIYGATISLMGTLALLNYLVLRSRPSQWMLTGAVLFVISDAMIALNSFYQPWPFYGIAIMFTYILAQYLICKYVASLSKS